MQTQIFVNLVVADLAQSKAFYEALGYSFNPQFTDDTAACLVISDTIYAMLLLPETMKRFTQKRLVDAKTETEALLALSFPSREAVDAIAEKALAAGGTAARDTEDLGFMYNRPIQDPDGHVWEFFYMDPAAAGAPQAS